MKVLVTGFDPFGGERVNPAYEAVKALPDTLDGAQIYKRELPTAFARSAAALHHAQRNASTAAPSAQRYSRPPLA